MVAIRRLKVLRRPVLDGSKRQPNTNAIGLISTMTQPSSAHSLTDYKGGVPLMFKTGMTVQWRFSNRTEQPRYVSPYTPDCAIWRDIRRVIPIRRTNAMINSPVKIKTIVGAGELSIKKLT
jgi:hypothetical protein